MRNGTRPALLHAMDERALMDERPVVRQRLAWRPWLRGFVLGVVLGVALGALVALLWARREWKDTLPGNRPHPWRNVDGTR